VPVNFPIQDGDCLGWYVSLSLYISRCCMFMAR